MARNTLANTGAAKKRLSKKARDNKKKYDAEFQKKPSQVKKRVEANRANRKSGTYGNKDGQDASHQKDGSLRMEPQSKNRGRRGEGGRVKKK